jgi:4'-phosphopantetheinyl transferase
MITCSPKGTETSAESHEKTCFMIQDVTIHSLDPSQPVSGELMTELFDWLDSHERIRHERLVRPADRHAFVLSHALTRKALGDALGIHPKSVRFEKILRGKPVCAPSAGKPYVHFNLSHTHGLAAIAIGPEALGLDVESLDRRGPDLGIAKRFFSPHEHQDIALQPEALQRERLLLYWTLKEAFLKAEGWGVMDGLDSFEFHLNHDSQGDLANTVCNLSASNSALPILMRTLDARCAPTCPWLFWHARPTQQHLMSLAVEPRKGCTRLQINHHPWTDAHWVVGFHRSLT